MEDDTDISEPMKNIKRQSCTMSTIAAWYSNLMVIYFYLIVSQLNTLFNTLNSRWLLMKQKKQSSMKNTVSKYTVSNIPQVIYRKGMVSIIVRGNILYGMGLIVYTVLLGRSNSTREHSLLLCFLSIFLSTIILIYV